MKFLAYYVVSSLLFSCGTCYTSSATSSEAELILDDIMMTQLSTNQTAKLLYLSDNIDEYLSHPLQELNAAINKNDSHARQQWRREIELKVEQVKESIREDVQNGSVTVQSAESVQNVLESVSYFTDGFEYGDWKSMVQGGLSVASLIAGALGPLGGHSKAAVDTASILVSLLPKQLPTWIKSMIRDSEDNPDAINWNPEDGQIYTNETDSTADTSKKTNKEIDWNPFFPTPTPKISNETANVISYLIESWNNLEYVANHKQIAEQEKGHYFSDTKTGLVSFGRLRDIIRDVCRSGKLTSQRKNNDAVKKRAFTCTTLVNHYVTMSIENQYLLTNMAAALNDGNFRELKGTAMNFIDLVKEEQRRDKEAFRFLFDPIDFPDYRYSVFEFYENSDKFELPISYMKTLERLSSGGGVDYNGGESRSSYVLACDRYFLQGSCDVYEETEEANFIDGLYLSVFVPQGVAIKSISFTDDETIGTEDEKDSSDEVQYQGPAVYHEIFTKYVDGGNRVFEATSFRFDTVESHKEDAVMLCYKDIKVDCQLYPISEKQHKLTLYKHTEINSIWIPEDVLVEVYDHSQVRVATYVGPDKINKVCFPQRWGKIKVTQNINGTRFVKLCSQSNFKGACHQIPSSRDVTKTGVSTEDLRVCIPQVRSMRVQDGVRLTITPASFGPFFGPKKMTDVSNYNITSPRLFRVEEILSSSFNSRDANEKFDSKTKSEEEKSVKSAEISIKSNAHSRTEADGKDDITKSSDKRSVKRNDVKRDDKTERSDAKSDMNIDTDNRDKTNSKNRFKNGIKMKGKNNKDDNNIERKVESRNDIGDRMNSAVKNDIKKVDKNITNKGVRANVKNKVKSNEKMDFKNGIKSDGGIRLRAKAKSDVTSNDKKENKKAVKSDAITYIGNGMKSDARNVVEKVEQSKTNGGIRFGSQITIRKRTKNKSKNKQKITIKRRTKRKLKVAPTEELKVTID